MGHIRAPRFWPSIVVVSCGCDWLWQRIGAWVTTLSSGRLPSVSVYAFAPDRRQLVVVWPAVVGSLARVVVAFDATVADGDVGTLCAALSRLSKALWDTYVHPASAAGDEEERARREGERARFDGVVAAVCRPNLPDESGALIVSYSRVGESAHGLGRVLHRLANRSLVE